MIHLEKLYECADRFLTGSPPDWDGFAREFARVFNARMVLYRPRYQGGELGWREQSGLVATSDHKIAREYVDKQVANFREIPESSLQPLEPMRRRDHIDDRTFRGLEIARDFYIPNGIFFIMVVLARLEDGTHLSLVVWRDETQQDFSDIEKQRLALFMRYLVRFAGLKKAEWGGETGEDVRRFGERFKLTGSEIEVLDALLRGSSLRDIADETKRSYGTVRWHVQNILEKCQVKSQKNLLSEFYRLIKH